MVKRKSEGSDDLQVSNYAGCSIIGLGGSTWVKLRLKARRCRRSTELFDPASLRRRNPWDRGAGASLGWSIAWSSKAKSCNSFLATCARIMIIETPVTSICGKNPMPSRETCHVNHWSSDRTRNDYSPMRTPILKDEWISTWYELKLRQSRTIKSWCVWHGVSKLRNEK